MVKKEGICIECNDGIKKPLINKKCGKHYWQGVILKSYKKTGGISKKTQRQANREAKFHRMKIKYLEQNPYCEIKIKCQGIVAIDVHHAFGKVGDDMFRGFVGCCRACHDWAEGNPEDAKKINISQNRLT